MAEERSADRRVLRARGRRAMAVACVVGYAVVFASIIAAGLEDRQPSGLTAWSFVVAILAIGVILGLTPFAMFGLSRVVVDVRGIEVRNWGTERRRVAWREISHFEVGSRWLTPAVGIAVLMDGTPIVMAGTSPIGPRRGWSYEAGAPAVQPTVDELNRRLQAARALTATQASGPR